MKKIFLVLAVALLVMHFNQSLNAAYWIALAVFTSAAVFAAYKLDKDEQRNSESNRADERH